MSLLRHVPPTRWEGWPGRIRGLPTGLVAVDSRYPPTLWQVRVQVLARYWSMPDSKWAKVARARVARPYPAVRDFGTEGAVTGPVAGSRAARSGGRSIASSAEMKYNGYFFFMYIFLREWYSIPFQFRKFEIFFVVGTIRSF